MTIKPDYKSNPAIVCFAKNPALAPVKTRLAKSIGGDNASRVYQAMLHDCLLSLSEVSGITLYLACHPDSSHAFFTGLGKRMNARLIDQKGHSLGARMLNCVRVLSQRHTAVVICGSDLPAPPVKSLSNSLADIKRWDVLVGPSRDGGFYLIGMKESAPIFDGVLWSSPAVLEQTVKNASKGGYSIEMLEEYTDIDDLTSLKDFIDICNQNPGLAPNTRAVLTELNMLALPKKSKNI